MHTDRLTAAVEEDLERAAKLLRAGELVAFPRKRSTAWAPMA